CAVVLPLLCPGLIAVGSFAFVHSWNHFPRASVAPRTAPASVHPAALPGSGARVVARPADDRPGGDVESAAHHPEREDTTRGH
ncbi:hypothetical protein AB0P40_28330, partial [Streptomyces sp. NPDC079189]|uniref:hypothetical protein n=1 Tax=Streptomyces sp. NPDC079189 TaxID=3154514 RepID=UPI003413F7BE